MTRPESPEHRWHGGTVRAWADAALAGLGQVREEVDALNVFPVADRDTGTNLFLTLDAARAALADDAADSADAADGTAGAGGLAGAARAVRALAHGALLGARGNSGVILSQLLRGFADVLTRSGTFDGAVMAAAFQRAADLAYDGVARPVEGTMLTVARAAADAALAVAESGAARGTRGTGAAAGTADTSTAVALAAAEAGATGGTGADAAAVLAVADAGAAAGTGADTAGTSADTGGTGADTAGTSADTVTDTAGTSADTVTDTAGTSAAAAGASAGIAAVARAAAAGARDALALTPSRLAVLAEAGVVDAGGRGLVVLYDVLAAIVAGRDPEVVAVGRVPMPSEASEPRPVGPSYEVIYLIEAADGDVDRLRGELEKTCAAGVADSLVVVGGDGLWRVHVHVDEPGPVLEAGVAIGRLSDIHVTYLATERPGRGPAAGQRPRAVVAVAHGPGLAALLSEAGAHVLPAAIGRTPSSAEFVAAITATHADEIIVLANDTAGQAAADAAAERITADSAGRVRVAVVPTRTAVHGIAALAVHEPGRRFDHDVVAMTATAGAARHGALLIAAEPAWTSVGVCRAGDVLGYIENDVALIGTDQESVAVAVVERMVSVGGEMVTLVTGEGAVPGLADAVVDHLRRGRAELDVVTYDGGQAGLPLLVGVE